MTITLCTRCGGEWFKRQAPHYDQQSKMVTEFAECLTCGEIYLYTRAPKPEERR